jgi:restriction system protein
MSNVTCSDCGTPTDEKLTTSDDRRPCPNCGSLRRTVSVEARMTASASVRATATVIEGPIGLLGKTTSLMVQSTVIALDPVNRGRLIESVTGLWFDIVDLLRQDPAQAFQIPPERWEEIIAGSYKRAGFDEVILTPRSGDLGRDVIATKKGIGSIRVLDQVKAYKPGHLVTADDVRALLGVVTADRASKGFLTTTSAFAPNLPKDPLLERFIPDRLELIDGVTLQARLEELARDRR